MPPDRAPIPTGTVPERLARVETNFANVAEDIRSILRELGGMRATQDHEIASIRDELRGRPSWAVVTYITLSTAANAAFLGAFLSGVHLH